MTQVRQFYAINLNDSQMSKHLPETIFKSKTPSEEISIFLTSLLTFASHYQIQGHNKTFWPLWCPLSVCIPLLGASPLSDPILDHSYTLSSCSPLGKIAIPFPAANVQFPPRAAKNCQLKHRRTTNPHFLVSSAVSGWTPRDRIILSGYHQLCEQGWNTISWVVLISILYFLVTKYAYCTDLFAL